MQLVNQSNLIREPASEKATFKSTGQSMKTHWVKVNYTIVVVSWTQKIKKKKIGCFNDHLNGYIQIIYFQFSRNGLDYFQRVRLRNIEYLSLLYLFILNSFILILDYHF